MNTKKARLLPITWLVMLLVPLSVGAQSAEERIDVALDRATEAGISTSLLEGRVDEASARGLPMNRIADAVERRLEGLERARQALAGVPDTRPDDLDLGADALEAGVSEEVLAALGETTPRQGRAAALAALTYLVTTMEVTPEAALDQVREALDRGPDQLENLRSQAGAPAFVDPPVEPVSPPVGVPAPGASPTQGPPQGADAPADLPTDRPGA